MKKMEVVWKRILAHRGESFYTKRGIPFTYTQGKYGHIYIETVVSRPLTFKLFEKALIQGKKSRLADYKVYAISHIYAILADERIAAWK